MKPESASTTHRSFVSYIDRTREFYAAQGYERPYRWARHDQVPFTRLAKPLSECRLSLVTTASPFHEAAPVEGVLRGEKTVWSAPLHTQPERLYTRDLAWDKQATHTDDLGCFVPIDHLHAFVEEGRVGSLTERFHGVPTDYSQRRTLELDAPEILSRCREDGADAVLLVPL